MGGGRRVLLVDDDEQLRFICRMQLQRAGYEITESASAGKALVEFAAQRPDLVILDLGMAEGDGWEFLAGVDTEAIPVVVFTASVDDATERRARDAGAAAFVAKPVQVNDLVGVVEKLLH
jgi:two-component system KDP operon response regulator KdpE